MECVQLGFFFKFPQFNFPFKSESAFFDLKVQTFFSMNIEKSLSMKHKSVQQMPAHWYFVSFFVVRLCSRLLISINCTNSCGFLGLNSAISAGQYTHTLSRLIPL